MAELSSKPSRRVFSGKANPKGAIVVKSQASAFNVTLILHALKKELLVVALISISYSPMSMPLLNGPALFCPYSDRAPVEVEKSPTTKQRLVFDLFGLDNVLHEYVSNVQEFPTKLKSG